MAEYSVKMGLTGRAPTDSRSLVRLETPWDRGALVPTLFSLSQASVRRTLG